MLETGMRLMAAAKMLDIGSQTLIDYLVDTGYSAENLKPTSKLTNKMLENLKDEFSYRKPVEIMRLQGEYNIAIPHHRFKLNQNKEVVELNLSSCNLYKIPSLEEFPFLEVLNLNDNNIQELIIRGDCKYLRILELNNNKIRVIENLDRQLRLKKLTISKNELRNITGLEYLRNLETLDLKGNYIEAITGLEHLQQLKHLMLQDNRILIIEGLRTLKEIQILMLGGNDISNIRGLEELQKLKKLYLNDNVIKKISGLEYLTNLTTINIAHNYIVGFPDLSHLKLLVELNAANNEIASLSNLEELNELRVLNVSNNHLDSVNEILHLSKLERVHLNGNAIYAKIPEEVIEVGWKAIRDRFSSNLVHFRHVKILLLGNSNVGKSNLLEFLKTGRQPVKNESTHGIVYTALTKYIPKTTLHVWDFGGQEYFHSTHRLFFSPGALNIILWATTDIPRNENVPEINFNIKYWLRCVEQLAGDDANKKIEVLICENKIDLNDFTISLQNQSLLAEKFPVLQFSFTAINLHPLKKMGQLNEVLKELVEKMYTEHPLQYLEYLTLIENHVSPILKLEELPYENIEFAKTAMMVFHNMGLLLYFPSIIPNKVFVKPQILLNLLYDNILGKKKKQEISKDEIEYALRNNPLELEINEVIALLKYFDIVFQIEEKQDSYFIPQYLKSALPFTDILEQHHFSKPNIRIQSDSYLMNSAMLKIYSRYGKFVKGRQHNDYLFWRDGIVIEKEKELLMIKFNRQTQLIEFYPTINNSNLSLQKEVIDYILSFSSRKTMSQDFIPSDEFSPVDINWWSKDFIVQVSVDGQYFTDWNSLYSSAKKGIFQIEVFDHVFKTPLFLSEKSKSLSVFDFNKYLPKKQQGQLKKIFISYSKEDLRVVKKFISHLSALQLDGKVDYWYCTELTAGSDWNYEIQKNFDESDIVCFLISSNFMKTKYIHEHEIAKAFARKKTDDNFLIIPIILDYCNWQTVANSLSTFNVLPFTAKPVSDFNNPNIAWYLVEQSLRLIIEKDFRNQITDIHKSEHLPKDVLELYIRLVEGKLDNNSN